MATDYGSPELNALMNGASTKAPISSVPKSGASIVSSIVGNMKPAGQSKVVSPVKTQVQNVINKAVAPKTTGTDYGSPELNELMGTGNSKPIIGGQSKVSEAELAKPLDTSTAFQNTSKNFLGIKSSNKDITSILPEIKTIPEGIYNFTKGIVGQFTNPDEEQQAHEKIIDKGTGNPITDKVIAPVYKGVTRFFSPMFRGYASDVAQGIAAGEAYQNGVSQEQVNNLFPAINKSELQVTGDILSAAASIYFPNVFAKGASGVANATVKQSIIQGMKNSVPMATTFSAASVLSSGTKDPKEAASIFTENFLGLMALGALTHSAIPMSKAAIESATKEIITTHNLPREIYIEPGKIKDFTTAEESQIINSLNLSKEEFVNAFRNGLKINIPIQDIVKLQDRSWFAKLKNAIGFNKAEPRIISQTENPATSFSEKPNQIAGLLESGKEIPKVFQGEIKTSIQNNGTDATILAMKEQLGVDASTASRLIQKVSRPSVENDFALIHEKAMKTIESDAKTKIDKPITESEEKPQTMKASELISHEGAPDKERVEFYKDRISKGLPVDPLKVIKEGNKYGIEDGKHTFEGYNQLGITDIPVKDVTPNPKGDKDLIESKVDNSILEPVKSEGKLKVSRLAERVAEAFGNITESDRANLPTYNEMNTRQSINKASEIVSKDTYKALNMLQGKEPLPEGVNEGTMFVALTEYADLTKDYKLGMEISKMAANETSTIFTAMGQNISALREFNKDNPVNQIMKIEQSRKKDIQKKLAKGKDLDKIKKDIVQKGKEKLAKRAVRIPKMKELEDFINSIEC